MAPVTTRFGPPKQWSWSYSKLKNFETCPLRHQQIDLLKEWKDTGEQNPGSPLALGKRDHLAMRDRLVKGTPFPIEIMHYEKYAVRVLDKVKALHATLLVEQQYAIKPDFTPTGYYAPDVWYRGIADALVLGQRAALVIDWKTGKIPKFGGADPIQLALMAQCIFSFYPQIEHVASRYVWFKEHAETDETFTRADMVKFWPAMLDRVALMKRAGETNDFPARKNGLCHEYCPVETCVFYKK